MLYFVVDKIMDAEPDRGPRRLQLVLGVAYKRDIDDLRESPSLDVMTLLHQKGAYVRYADPHVPTLHGRCWHGGFELHTQSLTPAALAAADCVAILTEHTAVDYDMVSARADDRHTQTARRPPFARAEAGRPGSPLEPALAGRP
jgi:UDP-N-acetyl-D-glucosamine dehydrogenase